MALLDDLIFGGLGTPPTQDASEPALGILGFVFWVVIALGGIGGGFFILRWLLLKFSYDEGEIIAPYRIIWQGKYASIEGNLSVNESFDEEVMTQLERHSDMKYASQIIRNEIRNKNLFVYNFRVTDEGNVVDSFSKKSRIISPVDMTQPKYTWLDSQGKRNLGSVIRREKRRNIMVFHTSRKVTILDEDGNEEDWFILSPIPKTEEQSEIIKFNSQSITPTPVHYIEITKIEGFKALTEFGSFAPTLAESIQKFLQVKSERDRFAQMYAEKVQELEDKNLKVNKLTHMLTQKIYVGKEQEDTGFKSRMTMGWILASGFVCFLMLKILPEFITTIDLVVVQLMGVGIGLALVGFLYKYYEEKSKSVDEKLAEE